MFQAMKISELQTARSNAARAAADAYCIELKEFLTFEKEYKLRLQYESELKASKLLSESYRRRSNIDRAREKTMLALNVAIQFKLDKFSKMEAQDTSHLAAHDNLARPHLWSFLLSMKRLQTKVSQGLEKLSKLLPMLLKIERFNSWCLTALLEPRYIQRSQLKRQMWKM